MIIISLCRYLLLLHSISIFAVCDESIDSIVDTKNLPIQNSKKSADLAVAGPCGCGAYFYSSALDCLLCPVNTYKPTIGGNSPSECLACPAGTFSSDGACSCTPAPTRAPTGAPCACGAYYDKKSKDCLLCPVGTYKPNPGGSSYLCCFLCPTGSSSFAGSCSCEPEESFGDKSANNRWDILISNSTLSYPIIFHIVLLFTFGIILVIGSCYCFLAFQNCHRIEYRDSESEMRHLCDLHT